jgi:hypothetical protein
MTNYRAFNALTVGSGQTGSLDRAWGILRSSSGAGVLYLEAKSGSLNNSVYAPNVTMSIADIAAGQPFPCHVKKVEVSAGTVYILA